MAVGGEPGTITWLGQATLLNAQTDLVVIEPGQSVPIRRKAGV
jgi:hypothetical protein